MSQTSRPWSRSMSGLGPAHFAWAPQKAFAKHFGSGPPSHRGGGPSVEERMADNRAMARLRDEMVPHFGTGPSPYYGHESMMYRFGGGGSKRRHHHKKGRGHKRHHYKRSKKRGGMMAGDDSWDPDLAEQYPALRDWANGMMGTDPSSWSPPPRLGLRNYETYPYDQARGVTMPSGDVLTKKTHVGGRASLHHEYHRSNRVLSRAGL